MREYRYNETDSPYGETRKSVPIRTQDPDAYDSDDGTTYVGPVTTTPRVSHHAHNDSFDGGDSSMYGRDTSGRANPYY